MARYEVRLKIVKRFEHDSGRYLTACHDLARDLWIVEERLPPDGLKRHRWNDLTEQQAIRLCLYLVGDGAGWRDVSW